MHTAVGFINKSICRVFNSLQNGANQPHGYPTCMGEGRLTPKTYFTRNDVDLLLDTLSGIDHVEIEAAPPSPVLSRLLCF